MQIIQTVTLGSAAASIDLNSIPQTFDDLFILLSVRMDFNSTDIQITFNGNTSNYSRRQLFGNGSSAGSGSGSDRYIGSISSSTMTASTFGSVGVYSPNYRVASAKSYSSDSVAENNATTSVQVILAGLWNDTAAITSISFGALGGGGNLSQYSSVSLYGITKGSSGGVTVS